MRPSMQARRVEFLPLGGTYIHVTNKLMYVYVYVTSNKSAKSHYPHFIKYDREQTTY